MKKVRLRTTCDSIKTGCIILCVALLSACATPASLSLTKQAKPYQMTRGEAFGAIFIYRERENFGSARGIYLLGNGKRIGGVNTGTYFVFEALPGQVAITAENTMDSKDSIVRTINVVAGAKYYIRASLRTGFWDAQPAIEIVNPAEGEQAVLGLSYETLPL